MDFSIFRDIPIIDCHVHVWSLDGVEEAIETMQKAGYAQANIVSTISINRVNFNAEAIYLKAKYPDIFHIFGGLII